jgi:hypothetical protein
MTTSKPEPKGPGQTRYSILYETKQMCRILSIFVTIAIPWEDSYDALI